MGVAVLQPHDCLNAQYPHHHHHQPLISSPRPKQRSNPNPKSIPTRSRRHKHSPNGSPSPPTQSRPSKANSPVLGQIRILKRGEELSPVRQPPMQETIFPSPSGDSLNTKNNNQPKGERPVVEDLRSKTKSILKEVNPIIGFYAGSSVASPPPSSLPLPAFFTKKKVSSFNLGDAAEEVATNGLRKLLKLDGF